MSVQIGGGGGGGGARAPPPHHVLQPCKITTELPVCHIPLEGKWKHIKGLHFADPDLNVPRSVDLLLGADLFETIIQHGWWIGPQELHLLFK